jgi:hypothetical protein
LEFSPSESGGLGRPVNWARTVDDSPRRRDLDSCCVLAMFRESSLMLAFMELVASRFGVDSSFRLKELSPAKDNAKILPS